MSDAEMIIKIKERLAMLGYEVKQTDEATVAFSYGKVKNTILNDCNLTDIPGGLEYVAVDMSTGEFLLAKKTFAPGDLTGLDIGEVVKSIQTGDTTVQFDSNTSSTAALDTLINHFLTYGKRQFACFRRMNWD